MNSESFIEYTSRMARQGVSRPKVAVINDYMCFNYFIYDTSYDISYYYYVNIVIMLMI